MLVATTRAPVSDPAGVMFGGERARGLRFADIEVSIRPTRLGRSARSNGRTRPAWRSCP